MWIETERMYTRRQPTGRCHVAWDASGRIPKDSCAVAFFIHLPNKDVGFGPKNLAARMASRPSTVTEHIRGSGSRLGLGPSLQSPFRGLARQQLDCNSKPHWHGS